MEPSFKKEKHRCATANEYRELCRAVFERDGWKCRICSEVNPLECHHWPARSHGGQDLLEEGWCYSLCHRCHERFHRDAAFRDLAIYRMKNGEDNDEGVRSG